MIALKCTGCGANLEIGVDLDVFACSYCGTQQKVIRSGSTVSLEGITDALSGVRSGTDRTASELALARLKKEGLPLAINEEAAAEREYKELKEQHPLTNPKYKSSMIWSLIWLIGPLFFYDKGRNGWFIAIVSISGFVYFGIQSSKHLPPPLEETHRLRVAKENVVQIKRQIAEHEAVVNRPL
jgi:hypothetical protein